MRAFIITITMPDGSRGRHQGMYTDSSAAIIETLDAFPEAKTIGARRDYAAS